MVYYFVKWLTYIGVRLFFNMRYEGLENIPTDGGYVLCGNHRSYWDPVFIVHKIPAKVHFMAKSELFRNKLFGALLTALNAFPVERGKGDTTALDRSAQVLDSGGVLIIFPEGHRYPNGIPGRAKSGAAMLSAKAGVPVLCCSIDYGAKLRFRETVTLRYHPALTQERLGISLESPSSVRAGTKIVMDTIESGLTLCQKERMLNAGQDSV